MNLGWGSYPAGGQNELVSSRVEQRNAPASPPRHRAHAERLRPFSSNLERLDRNHDGARRHDGRWRAQHERRARRHGQLRDHGGDDELEHIDGTTSRFVFYRATELALTLGGAGIATYGFAADKDLWKGIGIGVTAIGLPFLIIDTINNTRAQRYQDQVSAFSPGVSVKLQHRDWMMSFGGRF